MATASRRTKLIGGVAAVVMGGIIAAMVYRHPKALHARLGSLCRRKRFCIGGAFLLAGAVEALRLQQFLGIAVALSLFAICLWVAIGPGERACSMTIPFFRGEASDVACRGAFGFGSLLVALFLALLVRRAIQSKSKA